MPSVENVVFFSLVLDLFAFTIPLPLFPRIIEWYTQREAGVQDGLLARTLGLVVSVRSYLYKPGASSHRWDVVLLGGMMGSLFSTLQWLVSPRIGALSDKYGRRNVLLVTMFGNILSALVWIQSTTFASYMLSRAIGGMSEGNVQLAIAILSDITTPANRSKALAYVGIAFAICFIIGPPIGAYFASRPFPLPRSITGIELNIYATPAILTLILLVAETIFLYFALPETRNKKLTTSPTTNGMSPNGHVGGEADGHTNGRSNGSAKESVKETYSPVRNSADQIKLRKDTLQKLKSLHFLFLGIFSGVEFTLTFLTFDLFDWSNSQNGSLIGFIGIISALLQGSYVRRAIAKTGEVKMAQRGIGACMAALVLMSMLPHAGTKNAIRLLFSSATCLAFTSATVVNSLTAYASLQCDEAIETKDPVTGKPIAEGGDPALAKGLALGRFRSSGQLGRAIGPLLACASYWIFGPSFTYGCGAASMAAVYMTTKSLARSQPAFQ